MAYNVSFIGRIGTDVETVTTGSTPFITCRVAVDETLGKDNRATRWISVSADAARFKNMTQYLTKGKLIFVAGTDRVSAYTTKNGEVGVDTKVWADRMEFLPLSNKQEDKGDGTATTQEDKNAQMTTGTIKKSSTAKKIEAAFNDGDSDDLPF